MVTQVEAAEPSNSRPRDEMSVCEGADEFCPEVTSPPEPSEVESMFDSEDEASSG